MFHALPRTHLFYFRSTFILKLKKAHIKIRFEEAFWQTRTINSAVSVISRNEKTTAMISMVPSLSIASFLTGVVE